MEIALPILGTVLISGATTCFAINKERKQKRLDVGGDQLKQLFEEYDEHIQYLHKLNVLAKDFKLAFKGYNQAISNCSIKLKHSLSYNFIQLDNIIDSNIKIDKEYYQNLNDTSDCCLKIYIINDDNLLFFIYSISAIFAWIQIKKKNINNLHASVMEENDNLQLAIDKYINLLNNSENKLYIPIHLQNKLGDSLISSKSITIDDKEIIKYDILTFNEFKEKLNSTLNNFNDKLDSLLNKNNSRPLYQEKCPENNIILNSWAIYKNRGYSISQLKHDIKINLLLNENLAPFFHKVHQSQIKIQDFFNEYKCENDKVKDWFKIFITLMYITIFNYFSKDRKKKDAYKQEMRKNWLLFLKEINSKDNIIETDFIINDINLCETDTPLEPFIDNWKKFFKKKIIEKNINVDDIKSKLYLNNQEAYYLKKYMCKNAIKNITGNSIDTYKFMEFINNTKYLDYFDLYKLPNILALNDDNLSKNLKLPETLITFNSKHVEIPLFTNWGLVYHTSKLDKNGNIILHIYQKDVINLKLIKSYIEQVFNKTNLDDIIEEQIKLIKENLKNNNKNLLKYINSNSDNNSFKDQISEILNFISYDKILNDDFISYYVKIDSDEYKIINNPNISSDKLEIVFLSNETLQLDQDIEIKYRSILNNHKDDIYIRYENSNFEDTESFKINLENNKFEIDSEIKSNIVSKKFWITIIADSHTYPVFTKIYVKSKDYDLRFKNAYFLINQYHSKIPLDMAKKLLYNSSSKVIKQNFNDCCKYMDNKKNYIDFYAKIKICLNYSFNCIEIVNEYDKLYTDLIRYKFLMNKNNQNIELKKLLNHSNKKNSYKQYFDFNDFSFNPYFENLQKFTSLINRYKNNSLDYWKVKFIDIFKDILYEFINNYNSDQTLENINEITSDISKYSEKKILSDTEKRESLLKF